MSAARPVPRLHVVRVVGLTLALSFGWGATAHGVIVPPPVKCDVEAKGETVGTIDMKVDSSGLGGGVRGNEGLLGDFKVTKKKRDGTTMSLDELESFLGQHHLNWFQKIIRDTHPPNDCAGRRLTPPYIDPPSGGYCGPGTTQSWGDDKPWYWNETPKPAGEPKPDPGQLSDQSQGSTLGYQDYPSVVDATGPVVGAEVDFVTFLVSDYGNKQYQVLGSGISWSAKVVQTPVLDVRGRPIIVTNITSLKKGAPFTSEYEKEISDGYGYSMVPEPATWMLLGFGLTGLLGLVGFGAGGRP